MAARSAACVPNTYVSDTVDGKPKAVCCAAERSCWTAHVCRFCYDLSLCVLQSRGSTHIQKVGTHHERPVPQPSGSQHLVHMS